MKILKFSLTFVIIMIGINLNASSQNVFYRELPMKPAVVIDDDLLYIYTSNSMENPSQLIFRVILAVDQKTKSVFISAIQATGRPSTTKFVISSKYYHIIDPKTYKYYWLDPDRRKNQIDIISKAAAEKYGN